MTASITFAALTEQALRDAGQQATVVPVDRLCPGICQACDTDIDHPACAVVVVALHVEPTEPPIRVDGWSIPCCWVRLTELLAECQRVECVDGLTVEVPAIEVDCVAGLAVEVPAVEMPGIALSEPGCAR